ncbi:MAG: DUF2703 domain-containing protein [Desulfurivibrionaceae bacterium]|nr:DUF2703 domain-containing protein [Desulfurivibrionaceae bacterium]
MERCIIEWRHLDVEGETCDRCAETGQAIVELVHRLQEECRAKGVEILFRETRVAAPEIGQSNLILVNGVPLESLLPGSRASESSCCSCSELTGQEECCRTIIRDDRVYEAIPKEWIREAICRVARCC